MLTNNQVAMKLRGLLGAAAFLSALSASSGQPAQQTPPPSPEPQVVTVSARALPISAVSASITVLTRQDLEKSQAQTVVELLRQTPFLHLSRTGGRGGLAAVSVRGGDPNFTLIMIDNVPVNDPTNLLGGSFDLSSVSLDNLERIEIVRGPMSAIYGSEAIGGVINLISRKGDGRPSVSASGLAGNFETWQVGGSTSGKIRAFSYALAASRLEVGEQVENDSFSLGTVSWNSGVAVSGTQDLQFMLRVNDRESSGFPENGGGPEFSLLRDPKTVEAREAILDVQYLLRLSDRWGFRAGLDYYDRDEEAFTPAILDSSPPGPRTLPSFQTSTRFDRLRFGVSNSWDLTSRWATDVGFSIRQEDGSSRGLIAGLFPSDFSLERTSLSFNGELRYQSSDFHLNFGVGWDRSDDFQSEVSPRVGAAYLIGSSGARLRASWGEGYKLPSFFALGEPNTGNPDLRPERSRGFDLGYEQELGVGGAFLSLTYFRNTFLDLIDFSPQEFRLVNRTRSNTQGLEFEARLELWKELRLGGHLTYLDAEIEGTDEPLRDRPRWRGGVRLDWRPSARAEVGLETLWVGPRFDFQLPVREQDRAGGYSTSSLAASYRFPHGIEVFGRIDNLLDRRFHEFVGFPDPGLYARVGLRYRFEFQDRGGGSGSNDTTSTGGGVRPRR